MPPTSDVTLVLVLALVLVLVLVLVVALVPVTWTMSVVMCHVESSPDVTNSDAVHACWLSLPGCTMLCTHVVHQCIGAVS